MQGTRSAWPKHARRVTGTAAVLVALTATACFTGDASDSTGVGVTTVPLRGCTVTEGGPPRTAPGGYYTNGTTVCTAGGTAHLFHGVDRPSLEWSPVGQAISAADFQAMAAWHANVVRIATNQDFWLRGAALYNANYGAPLTSSSPCAGGAIATAVCEAEAAGLDVILDLHWSDQGNLGVTMAGGNCQDSPSCSNQQQMADKNSVTFWQEVATMFKGDGRVLFELYNEPNGIPWDLWLSGGPGPGFQVVGMQELYDTVRGTGADNLVIAGGLDYAFNLSDVTSFPIQGYNIMYATHPYSSMGGEGSWPAAFGYLAAGDIAPVIATEFGDTSATCAGLFDTDLIQFADTYKISWTAWAWYPGGCSFPSLLEPNNTQWTDYTPTVQGVPVKAALLGYPWSAPAPTDAGADRRDATLDGEASVKDAPVDTLPPEDAAGDATEGGAATDGAADGALQTD